MKPNRNLIVMVGLFLVLIFVLAKNPIGYYCDEVTFYYHYNKMCKININNRSSIPIDRTHNDEYLAIVRGGYKYVPFIIGEMKRDEAMDCAIREITKIDIYKHYQGQLAGKSIYDLWERWWQENKNVIGVYVPGN